MQITTIHGGRTLHGRIRPAAAKNSVLPLLAASLLGSTPSRLRAVPPLADVATSLALLQAVGAGAMRQGMPASERKPLHRAAPSPTTSLGRGSPCSSSASWDRAMARSGVSR